jgi:hypothetical protein
MVMLPLLLNVLKRKRLEPPMSSDIICQSQLFQQLQVVSPGLRTMLKHP